MEQDDNEQSYHDLYLGKTPSIIPGEIGVCVRCLKDVISDDDYVINVVFIKAGMSGKTYSEHYHLYCWKKNDK